MIQKTLVLIKPDGVQRNLIGEIIKRFEDASLKVVELKMLIVSRDLISKHYPEDEEYMITIGKKSEAAGDKVDNYLEMGRMVVNSMRDFMISGPIVSMVLEGEEAVPLVRKVTGYTDPSSADKGTIRGDLGEDSIQAANKEKRPVKNLIHASGTPKEAASEIKLWFP